MWNYAMTCIVGMMCALRITCSSDDDFCDDISAPINWDKALNPRRVESPHRPYRDAFGQRGAHQSRKT